MKIDREEGEKMREKKKKGGSERERWREQESLSYD